MEPSTKLIALLFICMKKFYCFKLKFKCDRWRCDVFYQLFIGQYFLLYFLTTKKTLKIFCLAGELNRGPMG